MATTAFDRLKTKFGSAWHVKGDDCLKQIVAEIQGGADDAIQYPAGGTFGAYGAAPVTQPADADQAAITDNSGGAKNATSAVIAVAIQQTIVVPVQLADFVNSATWKLALPFAFTLKSALFRTGKPASTAAKAATLTTTVSGQAVTGGVMGLTTANQNATGGTVAASAISGANATGLAGGTVEFAVSGVTAFVEGDGYVEFTVTNNDLANTLATIIAQGNAVRSALVSEGWLKGAA